MPYKVTKEFGKLYELMKDTSKNNDIDLDKAGKLIIAGLKERTPVESGKTADSYYYRVKKNSDGKQELYIGSSSVTVTGTPIAILLNYGHGTVDGGYVPGSGFITDVIDKVYKELKINTSKGG